VTVNKDNRAKWILQCN